MQCLVHSRQVVHVSGDYLTRMRTSVARSYALGTQVLIPWDTYYTTTERVWCTVDELGDIYHFVRQYPYLFDDYEVPAIVGIALNPTDGTQKTAITTLSNAGITVKVLPYMPNGKYATYTFAAEDVEGLDYVLELASLSKELKATTYTKAYKPLDERKNT